ncbi:hypothetical protein RJ639_002317 [Escallonia herrerae]|uniref:AAA+ ATPase domain-containing protein n=1 Tax=Escallonia herrerae TaxID=1293975 RepID=A0AA88X867_9ASTE|nr:hypothetical protein RJ639_002317 [Escallonia herrerae]
MAMDPQKKLQIMADLRDFADGQSFYQRTGRAWKRGYLLYGPPGTGKSSMIAAMANFLRYDIYDLELTEVHTNGELRKLLMKTSSKSIIVIEDIDCSINLGNRKEGHASSQSCDVGPYPLDLPGGLNVEDFVFTTNHIEKLDPALLRSGRMDMHICMSYCELSSVKILLKNYLGFEDGDLEEGAFKELENVMGKARMTPADASEVLIKNRRDKEKAVRELVEELKRRVGRNRNGGFKEKDLLVGVQETEEQEQEKRALESPKEGCHELEWNFKKGEEEVEKGDEEKVKMR